MANKETETETETETEDTPDNWEKLKSWIDTRVGEKVGEVVDTLKGKNDDGTDDGAGDGDAGDGDGADDGGKKAGTPPEESTPGFLGWLYR